MNLIALILIVVLLIKWELTMAMMSICCHAKAVAYSERVFLCGAQRILRILSCYTLLRFNIGTLNYASLPHNFTVISNHQSLLDILLIRILLKERTVRFVAKDSLKRGFPAVSRLMRLQQHLFITREHFNTSTLHAMRTYRDTTKNNICVVIFPEGSRSQNGALKQFNSAGLRLMCSDRHSLVIAIGNCYRIASLTKILRSHAVTQIYCDTTDMVVSPITRHNATTIIERCRTTIDKRLTLWQK